ncbi:endolytic transglycosylase MltG [Segetibacter sp. 3557_3]|uniref:endolytic transglycosylase MltG n=1 Tax=Segetibacter sp. 3557_3 TaxID=2547429 RepID=UPI001058E497|nr:endolytic transglycosylase MltG [Segetibacter sp. 3557_3]TDH26399.1 endolytic transglycosylase MltG [Segetibacter sp. 3557_3]
MKKIILVLLLLIIIGAGIFAWFILGSGTAFSEKNRYLYIGTGKATKDAVMDSLRTNNLLSSPGMFEWVANRLKVWDKVKPGRFEIKKGQSVLGIARMIRNNQQSPVNFTILKLRVKEDLAKLIDRYFETDSTRVMSFLNNPDSLARLDVDSNTLMTIVIPNTYTLLWTTPVNKILGRLKTEQQAFWKKNGRREKAEQQGLTPLQVYTIASIVEEETNKNDEKGNIASVYINRLDKGMPLGADPTVKFALKDFALKRIYHKHLDVASPYNTYRNTGLPPGPICTPSPKTIDEVLKAPKTDYLFFVARSDFSGYHTFASNFADHRKYAAEYQRALDEYMQRKQKP